MAVQKSGDSGVGAPEQPNHNTITVEENSAEMTN